MDEVVMLAIIGGFVQWLVRRMLEYCLRMKNLA